MNAALPQLTEMSAPSSDVFCFLLQHSQREAVPVPIMILIYK